MCEECDYLTAEKDCLTLVSDSYDHNNPPSNSIDNGKGMFMKHSENMKVIVCPERIEVMGLGMKFNIDDMMYFKLALVEKHMSDGYQ